MKDFKIYLAGAMMHKTFEEMNQWREDINDLLREEKANYALNLYVVNPCDYYCFDNPVHQSEQEVMDFDLARVRESDILIVNMDGLMSSVGTIMEVYEAHRLGIPIMALDEKDERDKIHPWLLCCITRIESNKTDLVNYIGDFYFSLSEYYHFGR